MERKSPQGSLEPVSGVIGDADGVDADNEPTAPAVTREELFAKMAADASPAQPWDELTQLWRDELARSAVDRPRPELDEKGRFGPALPEARVQPTPLCDPLAQGMPPLPDDG
jgi:hypothetical protein